MINANLKMSSHSDPIILSFHESLLRASDVQLLQGPHWLNDQIISFYFEYLERVKYKDNHDMLFVSPEVTQCIKIVPDSDINIFLSPRNVGTKPFIFFALNDNESHRAGGSHWSLLVFSRAEKRFFHFDSSGTSNMSQCQQFVRKVKYYLECPDVLIKSIRCLQQSNSYDCGIHVLCMADNISDHLNRYGMVDGVGPLHYDVVSKKRNNILTIIKQLGGRVG